MSYAGSQRIFFMWFGERLERNIHWILPRSAAIRKVSSSAWGVAAMNKGERAASSGSRQPDRDRTQAAPIDLAHLERQTMGDSELAREVLTLFVQQSVTVRGQMAGAEPRQRVLLAHGLKGAARGVGAFAVAECADAIERNPDAADNLAHLEGLVEDVRAFVAAMNG